MLGPFRMIKCHLNGVVRTEARSLAFRVDRFARYVNVPVPHVLASTNDPIPIWRAVHTESK